MKKFTVIITGGTGSLGNKLVERFIKDENYRKIIVYSRDEYKQSNMKKKFEDKYNDYSHKLRFFIGDVRDKDRLNLAFNDVDYVIHAAAMKQVPACEYNPFEAIMTNIIGAQNVISAALTNRVKKVVALSTDKAVNPVNLYGGTKLVSDKLFVSANAYSGSFGTIFSVVRYGNVAGSRGSVIPYFKNLAKNGSESLPITDIRMTRFWINLEQGIDLVVKAINEAKGGEIFVSKIPSFLVTDLAKAINNDAKINEVGIREGEKLHEIMISKDDSNYTYEFKDHYIIYPHFDWWSNQPDKAGKKVNANFEYSSESNQEFLNVDQIKALLPLSDLDE